MIILWPVAPEHRRITQRFGNPGKVYTDHGLKGHEGLDLGVRSGTPVHAAHSGRVANLWAPSSYGKYIELIGTVEGKYSVLSLYGHLSEIVPEVCGEIVKAGTLIGYTGNTGKTSTGAHLHFGVCPLPRDWGNGYKGWVDPLPLLKEGERVMEEAFEAAKDFRYSAEEVERLFEEGDRLIAQGKELVNLGQTRINQARIKLLELVSPKNGKAYLPEILLGGEKPAGWEGR